MHDIGINIGFQRYYSAEWLKAGFYSTGCSDDASIEFPSSNQTAQGKDANETLSSFADLIEKAASNLKNTSMMSSRSFIVHLCNTELYDYEDDAWAAINVSFAAGVIFFSEFIESSSLASKILGPLQTGDDRFCFICYVFIFYICTY